MYYVVKTCKCSRKLSGFVPSWLRLAIFARVVSYAGRESIGTERVRPVVRLDRPSLLAWFLMEATPLCDVRGQGYLVHAGWDLASPTKRLCVCV